MSEADPTVLSYHDSLLRGSDLSTLGPGRWLNDKIIGFYFEYLEYEVYADCSDTVCFITPDVAQFVKLYKGDELLMFLDPLNLHQKELVLLAINDNVTISAGGSHWSLLVYSRAENSFLHYDSSRPHNLSSAQDCSRSLTPFLKALAPPKFREVDNCPQQDNSYDCGVYAICYAEAVCAGRLRGQGSRGVTEQGMAAVSPQKVTQWRERTQTLIHSLAAKSTSH